VLFRIAWGFVGSDTARFLRFLKSPLAAFHHLREFPRPDPDRAPFPPAASFVAHQCLTPGPASSSHASTSNKTSPPPHRVRAAQLLYLLVRQQGAHHGTPPPQTGPARRRTDVDPCRPSSACGTKPSRTRPVPRVSSSSFSLPSHSRIGETWQGPLSRAPWTAS